MGFGTNNGLTKTAGGKIKWAFKGRKEAQKLRDYLNVHIGTINMLLVRQGLEMLDVANEQSNENQQALKESIEVSSNELREVRGDLQVQALSVRENKSLTQKLFQLVGGDVVAPVRTLIDAVAKVW